MRELSVAETGLVAGGDAFVLALLIMYVAGIVYYHGSPAPWSKTE